MTCDLSTIYETTLAHLIAMAKVPGSKAHAWHRAQELDKDQSGLWKGIANDLKAAMLDGQDKGKASEGQSETKRL